MAIVATRKIQKTLDDLAWASLLGHVASRCHTERGSAAARALPLAGTPDEARARIAEIAEARLLHQLDAPMPLHGIKVIDELLGRVEKGGDLVGLELMAVGETVAATARARRHLASRPDQTPRLAAIAQPIAELTHVSGPILDSFEEGGRLADHASAALGPLRRRVAQLNDELSRRARDLLDDADIAPHLMDRFYTQREERYVVPLRADARNKVRGIVHGTSGSGQTVFVEPEAIVELNNRLKIAESELEDEERRILAELSGYVREEAAAIRVNVEIAIRLDVIDGAARLADDLSASAPEISDEGVLNLVAARHPLMELGGRACVPNDIRLAPRAIMIVSGPNAGGKTVALKTAGLAALMARAGLHVPAEPGSSVPFYQTVLTDIGDDQSLERNLSTFSAHVMHIGEFLEAAGPGVLILIDEIAVGTEPEQGAALAQAVLEALAGRGTQAIVTTHYERLKAMATSDARFMNASVGFDLERMAPTFRLHLGVPGSSGALLVARRLGLPGEVVGRAEAILGDRRTGVEELLTAVAEERRRLEHERTSAERARREADLARREAEAAERTARERVEKLRAGAHDEALAALRKARDEADRLKARLKKAPVATNVREEIAQARAELGALSERISGHAPAATETGRPARPEELVAGAKVIVAKLGGRGVVVSPPERGRVVVQVGGLRATAQVGEVRLDDGKGVAARPVAKVSAALERAKARAAPARPPTQVPAGEEVADEDLAPMRTGDNTCDVRGARVDEALATVDQFLDDALLAHRDVIFVIHGHGTGALKAAIREHLALHAAVARFRPGQEKEGGDGATVVWLDT